MNEEEAASPGHGPTPLAARVMELAGQLEGAGFAEPARRLQRSLTAAKPGTVRALAAGRFSVGKSTLINAFLGYPVLPGGLAPTTGAICRIAYGPPGALIRFNDGRLEEFPGPEALRPFVELQPDSPAAAARVASIVRVEVTLPLPLLAHGLEIVDSPGLDEDPERTERATSDLDSADIVLLVLAADQLLSEIERRFLLDQIVPRRPGALALVINFWDRIPEADRPALLERMTRSLEEMGLQNAAVQNAGVQNSVAIFPVSAGQTLRVRWRPGRQPPDAGGFERLESWLLARSAEGASLQAQALNGRLSYSLARASQLVERERSQQLAAARSQESAAATARSALVSAEEAFSRAQGAASEAGELLHRSVGLRVGSGEGPFKDEVRRRLSRDPYDTLEPVADAVARWWPGVLHALQTEAGAALSRAAGALGDAGAPVDAGTLPALQLPASPPVLQFRNATDSARPMKEMKETITGLLGSVSNSAADSAASLFRSATKATSALNPRAKQVESSALERLENAFSVAAYQLRQAVQSWSAALDEAVRTASEQRRGQLQEEVDRRARRVTALRTRVRLLAALGEEIEAVRRSLETESVQNGQVVTAGGGSIN